MPDDDTSPDQPGADDRSIEMEVEVPGTPEEVWRAIATGPGISSWYVPHSVEEREGGAANASFGPGPEMQVEGRVSAWEPPRRVVFESADGGPGLAFEWRVEAREGGSCVVRLVNSGFASGEEWDDQYDGMVEGWKLFLLNLQLHLTHFPGRTATPALPMAQWQGPRETAWRRMRELLDLPAEPAVGDAVAVVDDGAPSLRGEVVEARDWRLSLVTTDPAPGTAFLAAEGGGDAATVSVWLYLYGDDRDRLAEEQTARWQEWLSAHSDL